MERSLQLSKLRFYHLETIWRIGAVVDFRRDAKLLRTSVSGPVSFRWSSVPTCSFGSRKIVMHKKGDECIESLLVYHARALKPSLAESLISPNAPFQSCTLVLVSELRYSQWRNKEQHSQLLGLPAHSHML